MKNLLSILFLFISFHSFSQTAPVPDPNFLAFLKSNYPSTINSSNQLVISQAALVTGTIDCSNSSISSLSGIQNFTGINTLYASGNNLVSVNEISGLINLKYLHLTNNSLTTLPPLNNLTKLVYLICSDNQIKKIPDLTNNILLKQLIAFNNNIDSLPNLTTLTDLRKIDVGGNHLTFLPDLSKQTLLEELLCWQNNIDSLPNLNIYPNLFRINAGNNKIIKTPDISNNKRLKILSLNDNILTAGPDIKGLDSLTTVELYHNNLSFQDLIPYLSYPSYNSVFNVSPQNNFPGGTIQVNNSDTLKIPGIDVGLSGVNYKWYFNNQLLSITNDSLILYPFNISNEGNYTCKSTHPSFPGLEIVTDNYIVSLTSCLNLSGISFIIEEINCLKAGTLQIVWNTPPALPLTYTIKSSATGQVYSSNSGLFNSLTDSKYILTIQTGASCQKQYPNPINIPIEECIETYITPDKDGDKDSFYFTESGKAIIYDKTGAIVKTLNIPGEWDGSSKSGKLVSQGYYVADINDGEKFIKITVIY